MKPKFKRFHGWIFCAFTLGTGSRFSIDPTFTDANWSSMGGIPGANGPVYAAVLDGSGNLYIGGDFTVVGDVIVNHIAKWDGNSWSALGSGMGGIPFASVRAL